MVGKNFIVGSVSPVLCWVTAMLMSTFPIWKAKASPKYHKKDPSYDYLW